MQLLPILSTLRRHKTAASLIVIEIALTSAIICNALFMIANRVTALTADHGVPEKELVMLEVQGAGGSADADEVTNRDLAALRALPGVKDVAIVNQVLYGSNSNNSGVRKDPADKGSRSSVAFYAGSSGTLNTMGMKLVAGRDFKPEELMFWSAVEKLPKPTLPQIIINQTLAEKFFPGGTAQSAIGKVLYIFDDAPSTVVGVVAQLSHPYPGRAQSPDGFAVYAPIRGNFRGGFYLLRTEPAQSEALIKTATTAIETVDSNRIVRKATRLDEMRSAYYAQDRAMAWLMGGVIVALLLVTAFGIVGLASFWVQQRTRMIGTRRALGASAVQIRRYFQTENFILTTLGIVLGMVGAVALSLVLMQSYEMPQLPWFYLPLGAVALWLLGQVAVWAPARRAAALSPMAAMRG
jgi:putative ABC transport system permease protein